MIDDIPTRNANNQKFGNMDLRWFFASGLGVMFVGMLVLAIGDLAASRREERIFKWTGGATLIAGALVSIGAAVRLYIVENRPRR